MSEWWNSLNISLQIFYVFAIASSFLLLVQLILLFFGMDDLEGGDGLDAVDADVDSSAGVEHPSDLNVLSVRTIVAFFLGFGWTGVICLKQGLPIELSILIAFIVGLFFLSTIFYLMKALFSLRYSGNIHYKNAIGSIGTVYVPIPPKQSGSGQVEIVVQNRTRFVDAFSDSEEKIPSQSRVKVVGIIDARTLLVEPLGTNSLSNTKE